MKIILTSFKRYHEVEHPHWAGFSVAMYQPDWYPKLQVLRCFQIADDDGAWIRPRLFAKSKFPLRHYGDELYRLYSTRRAAIEEQISTLIDLYDTISLCCWCPNDRAAKRQLKEHGSYVCHLGIVQWFLRKELRIECQLTEDHKRMVQFPWRVR